MVLSGCSVHWFCRTALTPHKLSTWASITGKLHAWKGGEEEGEGEGEGEWRGRGEEGGGEGRDRGGEGERERERGGGGERRGGEERGGEGERKRRDVITGICQKHTAATHVHVQCTGILSILSVCCWNTDREHRVLTSCWHSTALHHCTELLVPQS